MELTGDGFDRAFKSARIKAGLTQEEAARELEVTTSTVRNWERGRFGPRYNELRRVCLRFGWVLPWSAPERSAQRATPEKRGRAGWPIPVGPNDLAAVGG